MPQQVPLAIELRDIVKRFPGVVANDGVNVAVRAGTIHALIGENGAGKSTVMKILYGAQRPDEGHHRGQRRREVLPVAEGCNRASASAWCSSTSCWPTT